MAAPRTITATCYYERVGRLPAPERLGGHCPYGPEVMVRLALIAATQQMGFAIAEIATQLHGFEADVRGQALVAKLREVGALITRAEGLIPLLCEELPCGYFALDACARTVRAQPSSDVNRRC